jgi:hypothetical protein
MISSGRFLQTSLFELCIRIFGLRRNSKKAAFGRIENPQSGTGFLFKGNQAAEQGLV